MSAPVASAQSPSAPASRAARACAAAAFGSVLALYLATTARTLQGGDSGEFALVGATGGVAHPPGYPLYSMLARMAAALLPGDPAWRAGAVSALCGAAAAAVLVQAGRRLTGNALASLAAALVFAVAPLQWRVATVPEVFSLNALLAAWLLLETVKLAQAANDGTPVRGAALRAGLAAGLGLSNHHTIVLCAPLLLWPMALLGSARAARAAGWIAVGGLAGLLPHAWLPFAAAQAGESGAFVWGEPATLPGLVRHFLRAEYGTFRLSLSSAEPQPALQAGRALRSAALGLNVLVPAALAGAVVLARRTPLAVAALGASFVLAGLVFPSLFNLPPGSLARAVEERFHLLPLVLLVPLAATGLAALRRRVLQVLAPAVVVVAFVAGAATGRTPPAHDETVERWIAGAVRELAPDAIVLGEGDVTLPGFAWMSRVRGVRPDVRYVDIHLLRNRWYYERVDREIGLPVPYDGATTHLGKLAARLSRTRPVYATWHVAQRLGAAPQRPEGLLVRLGVAAPDPEQAARLERASRGLCVAPAADAWSASLCELTALSWEALAAQLAAQGETGRADAALSRAAQVRGDS